MNEQRTIEQVNQCDGCRAGIPVDKNGNHRMGKPGGYADLMACTADRYGHEPLTSNPLIVTTLADALTAISLKDREIERLTAAKAEQVALKDTFRKEADRLREQVNDNHNACLQSYVTISRLRTALRNISKGRVGDQIIMDVSEYAKAQLREQPVETKT